MPEDQRNENGDPDIVRRGRSLPTWLRVALAGGLTAGLVWYLDPGSVVSRIRGIDPAYAGLACCALAIQYAMAAWRWHFVLRRHAVHRAPLQVQAIFGAGATANLAGLSAVAGMSVRGALLLRDGVPASRIIGVLFVERFSAMAGFVLCFVTGSLAALPLLRNSLLAIEPPAFVLPLAASGVAVSAVLGLLCLQTRFVRNLLSELAESFLATRTILLLAVLSCVIVWLGFAAVAVLARGMELEVNPIFFLVIMPVVAFLAALPVTLGGWGVREGSMVAGLLLFGIPAEAGAALSIAYGALGTAVTLLLGGCSALMLRRMGKQASNGDTNAMT